MVEGRTQGGPTSGRATARATLSCPANGPPGTPRQVGPIAPVLSRRGRPAAAALLLALLTSAPGLGGKPELPKVDLGRLAFSADAVHAPLVDGRRARLTLDRELQRWAMRLLARARPVRGAIVALNVRSGQVLVWAEWHRGARRHGSLLLQARSPAASVFKLVTAAALIEKAQVHPRQQVCTSGGDHRIDREHLRAPPRRGARCGPFAFALGLSRNAAFAQLATRYLKPSELVDTAKGLGFNHDVPFEGSVPLGRLDVSDEPLRFGRTAAGFAGSTLSPLGAAHLAYVVASGGWAVRIRIIDSVGDYQAPSRRRTLRRLLSPWAAGQLRKMMEVTVHSGTSLKAFTNEEGTSYLPGIRVAGKTGTLKVGRRTPTTSWFAGFAPSRRPHVVVSVLLENGTVWRQKANEVARDLLRVYFARKGVTGVMPPL